VIDLILAQNTQQQSDGGGGFLLVGVALMMVVWYFIVIGPQRKERKKQQDMLSKIKKNDRVMTIGGILGVVVGVKDNEITLKVDESNNVKITVIRSAIQRVLSEGEAPPEVR
jgi:preprotein translocase subunit YajC